MKRARSLPLVAAAALWQGGLSGCSQAPDATAAQSSTTGAEQQSSESTRAGTTDDSSGHESTSTTAAHETSSDAALDSSSGDTTEACAALEVELRELAEQYQQMQGLVGLAVSVGTGDCPPWSAAWGTAELPNTALTPAHLLRVGSVTKSYTAALILKLAEAGQLSLDDTLAQWSIDVPAAEITIRQLLNHTSGLADYQANPDFLAALEADPAQQWAPQDLVDYAVALPPTGRPGAEHAYSNANYILAALIAESAGGGSYAQLLRRHVLGPAGLEHSYLEDFEMWEDPTAAGYLVVADGPPQATAGQYHGSLAWSAGAVVATADDLRRWIATLLSSDFLAEESQMELIQLVDNGTRGGYGLGIFHLPFETVSAFGHNGAVLGFQASAYHDPKTRTSVAVLQNELRLDAAGIPSGDPTLLSVALLQAVDE